MSETKKVKIEKSEPKTLEDALEEIKSLRSELECLVEENKRLSTDLQTCGEQADLYWESLRGYGHIYECDQCHRCVGDSDLRQCSACSNSICDSCFENSPSYWCIWCSRPICEACKQESACLKCKKKILSFERAILLLIHLAHKFDPGCVWSKLSHDVFKYVLGYVTNLEQDYSLLLDLKIKKKWE